MTMTVKALVERLKSYPQDAKIIIDCPKGKSDMETKEMMMEQMVVYVLLEKTLATGDVFVVGVYESYEDAGEEMRNLMDMYVEERDYLIVDRTVV